METIARLINKQDNWQATIAVDVGQALEQFKNQTFQVVLLCAGLAEGDEERLTGALEKINANLPVVKHYGGGSGLLYAEIYQAISQSQKAEGKE